MAAPTAWADTLKDKLSLEHIKEFLSTSRLLEMVVYFGSGFLLGFFLKKFGKWVALAITVFIILAILQQFDLISFGINWRKIHELSGLHIPAIDESLLSFYWAWIKDNVMAVLIMALGFILGLRVG